MAGNASFITNELLLLFVCFFFFSLMLTGAFVFITEQENEFKKVTGIAERFVVLLFAFYMELKKTQLGSKKSYRLPQHLIVSVLSFPAGGYPSLCAPRLVFHGHEISLPALSASHLLCPVML